MSKLIKGDTSLRYQLDNTNKGKFTEIPYEFITCISVSGTNIVIDSDIDPNPQNIIIPYASITAPTSANITQLKEILWCWVLSKSRKPNDENGDPYILVTPEVEPCFGVIAHNSCPYVLQNVGGILYWDGSPIAGAPGSGILSVDNGLTENPVGNAQLGGTLIQDTYTDADGFEYFMNNFRIWRVQVGAADPRAAIICDATRTTISNSTSVEITTPDIITGTVSAGMALVCQDASTGDVDYRVMLNAGTTAQVDTYSPALQSEGFIRMRTSGAGGASTVTLPNITGANVPTQRFTIFNDENGGTCVISAQVGGSILGKFNGVYVGGLSVTLADLGDSVTLIGLGGSTNQWYIENHNR